MYRVALTIFICLVSVSLFAQRKDSLYVITKNDRWVMQHKVKQGETVLTIANDFHVPPTIFAGTNSVDYQTNLKVGSMVYIPFGAYNQTIVRNEGKPVYYKVGADENLYRIGQFAGVRQRVLQEWNNMPDNAVEPGQRLLVGWVLFGTPSKMEEPKSTIAGAKQNATTSPAGITRMADGTILIPMPKKEEIDTTSPEEKNYNVQTNKGVNAAAESGTVVFFDMPGKKVDTKYYAFHNLARRGVYIKVRNPGTDKTIFVKVIGLIPTTKQYTNAIIGISSNARDALGVSDTKSWCELSYGV